MVEEGRDWVLKDWGGSRRKCLGIQKIHRGLLRHGTQGKYPTPKLYHFMILPLKWKQIVGNKIHACSLLVFNIHVKEFRKQNKAHVHTHKAKQKQRVSENLHWVRRPGGDCWGQLTLEWRLWRQTSSLPMSTLSSSSSEISYSSILGSIYSDHQVT